MNPVDALGLYVARTFGAAGFGAFTLAYITYSVITNASRGIATDPLLVRSRAPALPRSRAPALPRSRAPADRRWREATASATGTALLVGILSGAVCP